MQFEPNNNSLSNADKALIVYQAKLLSNDLSAQEPVERDAYHGLENQMLPFLRGVQFPLLNVSSRLIGKRVRIPFFASTSTAGWDSGFGLIGDSSPPRYVVLKFDASVDKFSIESVTGNGESEAIVLPDNFVVKSVSMGSVSTPVFSKYLCAPDEFTTLTEAACSQEAVRVRPVFEASVNGVSFELAGVFQNTISEPPEWSSSIDYPLTLITLSKG